MPLVATKHHRETSGPTWVRHEHIVLTGTRALSPAGCTSTHNRRVLVMPPPIPPAVTTRRWERAWVVGGPGMWWGAYPRSPHPHGVVSWPSSHRPIAPSSR